MTNKYKSDILQDIFNEITPQEQARTDNKMLLAAKIKDAMDAKGLRKKEFAAMLNQKPSVITKWLSGTHNFTTDTLSDIQDVLNIKLLAVEEKKHPQTIHFRLQLTSSAALESMRYDSKTFSNSIFSLHKGSTVAHC